MNTQVQIKAEVERLFREAPDRHEEIRENPVTGSWWCNGEDPIGPQKQAARRALMAREWFAEHAPFDAPPLPLSYQARERMKGGGLPHILAWFARSLEARDYNWDGHPLFQEYARGVMASPITLDFIKEDKGLRKRFPPCPLPGLDRHLYWNWPLAPIRGASRFQQKLFLEGPPPPPLWRQISRIGATIPNWYAPWAQGLMQLDDEYIAHATGCGSHKRLPRGWRVHKPEVSFYCDHADYRLSVTASDYGWVTERRYLFNEHEEVLTHILCNTPVFCPTHVLAARLADAMHPIASAKYLLRWEVTV
jgi:hypothetical protein